MEAHDIPLSAFLPTHNSSAWPSGPYEEDPVPFRTGLGGPESIRDTRNFPEGGRRVPSVKTDWTAWEEGQHSVEPPASAHNPNQLRAKQGVLQSTRDGAPFARPQQVIAMGANVQAGPQQPGPAQTGGHQLVAHAVQTCRRPGQERAAGGRDPMEACADAAVEGGRATGWRVGSKRKNGEGLDRCGRAVVPDHCAVHSRRSAPLQGLHDPSPKHQRLPSSGAHHRVRLPSPSNQIPGRSFSPAHSPSQLGKPPDALPIPPTPQPVPNAPRARRHPPSLQLLPEDLGREDVGVRQVLQGAAEEPLAGSAAAASSVPEVHEGPAEETPVASCQYQGHATRPGEGSRKQFQVTVRHYAPVGPGAWGHPLRFTIATSTAENVPQQDAWPASNSQKVPQHDARGVPFRACEREEDAGPTRGQPPKSQRRKVGFTGPPSAEVCTQWGPPVEVTPGLQSSPDSPASTLTHTHLEACTATHTHPGAFAHSRSYTGAQMQAQIQTEMQAQTQPQPQVRQAAAPSPQPCPHGGSGPSPLRVSTTACADGQPLQQQPSSMPPLIPSPASSPTLPEAAAPRSRARRRCIPTETAHFFPLMPTSPGPRAQPGADEAAGMGVGSPAAWEALTLGAHEGSGSGSDRSSLDSPAEHRAGALAGTGVMPGAAVGERLESRAGLGVAGARKEGAAAGAGVRAEVGRGAARGRGKRKRGGFVRASSEPLGNDTLVEPLDGISQWLAEYRQKTRASAKARRTQSRGEQVVPPEGPAAVAPHNVHAHGLAPLVQAMGPQGHHSQEKEHPTQVLSQSRESRSTQPWWPQGQATQQCTPVHPTSGELLWYRQSQDSESSPSEQDLLDRPLQEAQVQQPIQHTQKQRPTSLQLGPGQAQCPEQVEQNQQAQQAEHAVTSRRLVLPVWRPHGGQHTGQLLAAAPQQEAQSTWAHRKDHQERQPNTEPASAEWQHPGASQPPGPAVRTLSSTRGGGGPSVGVAAGLLRVPSDLPSGPAASGVQARGGAGAVAPVKGRRGTGGSGALVEDGTGMLATSQRPAAPGVPLPPAARSPRAAAASIAPPLSESPGTPLPPLSESAGTLLPPLSESPSTPPPSATLRMAPPAAACAVHPPSATLGAPAAPGIPRVSEATLGEKDPGGAAGVVPGLPKASPTMRLTNSDVVYRRFRSLGFVEVQVADILHDAQRQGLRVSASRVEQSTRVLSEYGLNKGSINSLGRCNPLVFLWPQKEIRGVLDQLVACGVEPHRMGHLVLTSAIFRPSAALQAHGVGSGGSLVKARLGARLQFLHSLIPQGGDVFRMGGMKTVLEQCPRALSMPLPRLQANVEALAAAVGGLQHVGGVVVQNPGMLESTELLTTVLNFLIGVGPRPPSVAAATKSRPLCWLP